MSAHHFFIDDVSAETVVLTGDEASHAVRTLRVKPGEIITVGDGAGAVVTARVTSVGPQLHATVIQRVVTERARPTVSMYPAVPKSGKLELVVQKLTELGVDEILPWFAERTIVRWDDRKARANGERLRAVGREAAKQSRRAWLPRIADPAFLEPSAALVVLHEEETGTRLRDVLFDGVEAVGVVIGPEGGLSAGEVERFLAAGAVVAGLGEQVLRAETASIVAAALVLSRYGRIA